MDFRGKRVLVTGASRGLGRALVAELLNRGAETVYAAVRSDSAIPADGAGDPRTRYLVFDLRDWEGMAAEATQVAALDAIIHCAGVCQRSHPMKSPVRNLRDELDVNYLGAVRVFRAFRPVLRPGGCLVAIGSKFVFNTLPGLGNYCATKAALWSLIQSLAADPENEGISVQLICPGAIDTDMARAIGGQGHDVAKTAQAVLDAVGNGRVLVAVLDDSVALLEPLASHFEKHAAGLSDRGRKLM